MPEAPSAPPAPELTIAGRRIVRVQRWSRRRSVRWTLFLFSFLLTILALFVRSKELFLTWELVIGFDILFVVWPFFQGTYLLYTRHSIPVHADFKVANSAFFDGLHEFQVSPLTTLGFEFAGCLKQERKNPDLVTDVALFMHPDSGDLAQVAQVQASLAKPIHPHIFDKV
jgi:hypothetical protein